MAINFRSNTIIKNLRVGPLSGGGGGGGGSSEPSYLAVGAMGANTFAGTVYVYDATNYSNTPTRITASGLGAYSRFGNSIATNGSQLVVGSPGNSGQAYAYVYDLSNLSTSPTQLTIPGSTYSEDSVAATSNHIVVGGPKTNSNFGAVHVYDASNLSASPTTLAPSGLGTSDEFGMSVAATTNYIVAGAPYDDDQGNNAGAVYVYDVTNLSASPTKLTPSGIGENDNFGWSVAVYGNQIVVGAKEDDDQGENAGAVYVYDATNLSATPTKLAPSGLTSGGRFGHSVSVTSNHIVVGANTHSGQGYDAGAVYVYDANNLSTAPTELTGSAGDYFGQSVAVYGTQIVIGARRDGAQASNGGAVYVYDATDLAASPTQLAPSDLGANFEFGGAVGLG